MSVLCSQSLFAYTVECKLVQGAERQSALWVLTRRPLLICCLLATRSVDFKRIALSLAPYAIATRPKTVHCDSDSSFTNDYNAKLRVAVAPKDHSCILCQAAGRCTVHSAKIRWRQLAPRPF